MRRLWLCVLGLLCLGFVEASSAGAEPLITAREAALPAAPASTPTKLALRSITRRPEAAMSPVLAPGEVVKSPMTFRVKFVTHGGTKIDPASVTVTYLKEPLVDLTPRLRKYITPTGIEMPDAEIPAGEHLIRIRLSDSRGDPGEDMLTLIVGR